MTNSRVSWRSDLRTSHERGYGAAWQRARATHLRQHPLCVMCDSEGLVKAANVVDHIIPHRGNLTLFWDMTNWQSLCKQHHDSDKAMLERTGQVRIKFDSSGHVIW